MRYEQFQPDRALQAWVDGYWRLTADVHPTGPARPQRILPDGYAEVVLHLGDPFERIEEDGGVVRQPACLFAGQIVRPLCVRPTGRTHVWGVRLHPWALAAVAGMPAHELTGRVDCADAVCPRLVRDLMDALAVADAGRVDPRAGLAMTGGGAARRAGGAADTDRRGSQTRSDLGVRALDAVLLRHLQHPRYAGHAAAIDPRVEAAGRWLLRQPQPIAGLAARLGVSTRHLERAFQRSVGLTPKLFARISRFQRVAGALDADSPDVFASLALACGYYDQSHLVRDVRAFAGDTPVALRGALGGELAEYFLRARR